MTDAADPYCNAPHIKKAINITVTLILNLAIPTFFSLSNVGLFY